MRTIAYLRVSTSDQDIEKNKFEILKLANDKGLGQVEWIEETVGTLGIKVGDPVYGGMRNLDGIQ